MRKLNIMSKYFYITFFSIFATYTTQAQSVKVGDIAPDVVMTTPDGKEIKLSDYKGKMVLLDFWASWCAPCRRENPNIVAVYNKYKDAEFSGGEQGFIIFSVSLDSRQERWKEAIEKDNLDWEYHVSDMKGWRSKAAKDYGIRSIPANYLINGKGEIIAIYLRGDKLQETVNSFRTGWLKGVFNKN